MNVSLHSRIHITVRALLIGLAMAAVLCTTTWAASEKVLYRFHGKDGWTPNSVVLGRDGELYGTTGTGGNATKSCDYNGCGVIFRLTRDAGGKWRETVLHRFAGTDGWFPEGMLVADKSGNLYGTTVNGGSTCSQLGCGVVFEVARGKGGKWAFKVLHQFAVTDGANPYAGMIFDSQGNLYGTASSGGNVSACPNEGGCGVVFKLAPDGKGNWTESVLYAFNGDDGGGPSCQLIFDSSGNLYGTTYYGGANGGGTVFELTPGKNGQWSEQVLHSFSYDTGDGDAPISGLAFDRSGNLYGTTINGGTKGQQGWGVAFKLAPENGKWKETILHTFDQYKFDGGDPTSRLIFEAAGNLYGTADSGGRYACPGSDGLGCGVVFKLTSRTNDKWSETVVHSFGKGNDGSYPGGDLVLDSLGDMFGTTAAGGDFGGVCGNDGGIGCGAVFEITP